MAAHLVRTGSDDELIEPCALPILVSVTLSWKEVQGGERVIVGCVGSVPLDHVR